MITQQIKLNLIPGQVFPRVNASQYDSGTRTLQMALYNGDQVFNIASGMTAVVQGTKPDKTGFQYAATITEGSNIATLDITQQMTAVKGDVICELVISNGNNRIATVNFILYVEAAALAGDTVISETDLPLIEEAAELAQTIGPIAQQVNEDAQTASNAATRAEDAAEAAETWSSNAPYIGANDHWYVYDSATEQFVDTGVSAEGQTGPQGPQGPTGETGATGPQGPTGATGNGITSITKTSTVGLVDTYTILFTDGTSTTFTVTNGQDGQGSGDMTKAVYDPNNAVSDAGGIVAYVQAHSGAGTLAGLDDVALSSLASGQSLVYDATAQKWKNGQISYANISGKPTLGSAAAKNSTDTLSSGSTDLIESGAVHSAIQTLTNQVKDMNNVYGSKNLAKFKYGSSITQNGVTFTPNEDGTISVSGTATNNSYYYISSNSTAFGEHVKESVIWLDAGEYIASGGIADNNGDIQICDYSTGTMTVLTTVAVSQAHFTLTQKTPIVIRIRVKNGYTVNGIVYPMIRLASIIDDTYEPYAKTNQQLTEDTNAIEPMLNILGAKNLLPNNATSQVINGVTFTVNSDGSITVSGTATAETWYYVTDYVPIAWSNNSYLFSGRGTASTNINYFVAMYDSSTTFLREYRNNTQGTDTIIAQSSDASYMRVDIVVPNGATVSGTFYPMIRPASIADDTYVPYAMTNRELTNAVTSLNTDLTTITWRTSSAGFTYCVLPNGMKYAYKLQSITSGTEKSSSLHPNSYWSTVELNIRDIGFTKPVLVHADFKNAYPQHLAVDAGVNWDYAKCVLCAFTDNPNATWECHVELIGF